MSMNRLTTVILFLSAIVVSTAFAQHDKLPPLPATPAPTGKVHYAERVVLDESFAYEWRAERPEVAAGWLLVVDVDPACVVPRQTEQPVLYVGKQVAMRYNVGFRAKRVVIFVPSALDANGELTLKLEDAPIWFGAPDLPERVDQNLIDAERAVADARGVTPRPANELTPLVDRQRAPRVLANRSELDRAAARLIIRYVPEEEELGRLLLAPPPGGDTPSTP